MNCCKRLFLALCFTLTALTTFAQQTAPTFTDLKWRLIGPFRGGRSLTAEGVAMTRRVARIVLALGPVELAATPMVESAGVVNLPPASRRLALR